MAQFVPYLIVGAIGVIGQWLLAPKGSESNPNQMPQLNQSLRGSPVYVTFGTNRVNAQVVWTKNWKVVKGSGGKKGGGSGGGGAAKGGAAQGYSYFWDSMFNYGFVDVPAFIGRGWIGEDPIIMADIDALNGGISGAITSLLGGTYTSVSSNVASLRYTEANLSPGYPTGDVNLATWTYFQGQEGVACAWPSTFWVGFRALALGQTGQLPQLSFELVPLGAAITIDFNTINGVTLYELQADHSQRFKENCQSNNSIIGEDGKNYAILQNKNGDRWLYNVTDDTIVQFSFTDWQTDYTTYGYSKIGSDFTHGYAEIFGVADTPYFIAMSTVTGTTNYVGAIRYKIDATGTVVRQDGLLRRSSGSRGVINPFGTLNQPSIYDCRVIGSTTYVACQIEYVINIYTPTLVAFPAVFDEDVNIGSWDSMVTVLGFGDQFWHFGVTIYVGNQACILQKLSGIGVLAYDRPNKVMRWSVDSLTNDIMTEFDSSDAGFQYDGSVGSVPDIDNYCTPMQYNIDGTTYLFFTRPYEDQVTKMRVQLYDWQLGNPVLTNDEQGVYFNTADANGQLSLASFQIMVALNNANGQPMTIARLNNDNSVANTILLYSEFGTLTVAAMDVTPPYIIKRILTSKVWGFQTDALFGFTVTDTKIDSTSYNAAVAKCEAEGIKISVTYTNQESLLQIINELVALYNGYIVEHAGIIYFGTVTDTITAPPMRTINNSRLISPGPGKPPVDVTKGAIQDGYNIIEFQYLDRDLEYNQNTVWMSDEVDIDFNGPRHKAYPAKFVMAGSTAYQCAERALWSNLYGRDQYKFKLGAKDADLRPGNVITLVDSFDATLTAGVPAIITRWRESKRLEFDVEATRLFNNHLTAQHAYTATASIDPGFGGQIDTVQPPLAMRGYELPKRFQNNNAYAYFGWNQANMVMGGQLWLSLDGVSFAQDLDEQPFPTTGIVVDALPLREPGYVETNVEVYLAPTSGFNVNTPTFVQTFDLEDTTTSARQAGLTGMIVGSEFIACEGAVLLGQNHYRIEKAYRGWGGTPISAHSANEYWNHHGDGVFAHQIAVGDIGKIFHYKVLPYNFAGVVCDISSVNAQTYQI